MIKVRNGNMVACSATEVVNEIADLQGVREGNSPDTSVKSEPLVFKQQIPGEGMCTLKIILKLYIKRNSKIELII